MTHTIKILQIKRVPYGAVRPGDIIAEGIVYAVDDRFARVPLGIVYLDDTVQVYARLHPEAEAIFTETMMAGTP